MGAKYKPEMKTIKWIIENKTTENNQTEDSNATHNGEKELSDSNTSLTDNRPLNVNSRVDDNDVIFATAFLSGNNYIGGWW